MSGILAGIFEHRASAGESFHVSQSPPGWVETMGGYDTAAGRSVTPESSLQVIAVFACVRILAETVASLPLPVYRRLPNGGKARAPQHYLYSILHDLPNPEMTSFELRETLMGHLCTWGNAYAEIEIDRAGRVVALWPLRPDRMTVKRESGKLVYRYRLNRADEQGRLEVPLQSWQVLHVRGLGFNGIVGYSPIAMARQAVGLAQATEEFGARFFGNGARPGMVLEHPGKLSQEAHNRLRDSWEERHQGLEKSHRVAILEEGLKAHEIGLPPEDAQFLQTRKYQTIEIARLYRVPPHMLADLERATFSNIEHQSLDFVIHTARPWLVRWEQAIQRDLLTAAEREHFFAEFLVDGLLRGDIQSRYQAYSVGRQNGWLSANDVRELENMNPIAGGDVYLVPLNMIPSSQAGAGLGSDERGLALSGSLPPNPVEPRSLSSGPDVREQRSAALRHRLEQVHRPLYQETLARVLRRERNDVGGAVTRFLRRRDQAQFDLWLTDFYQEHGRFVYDQVRPTARAYGELVSAAAQEEVGQPAGFTPEMDAFEHSYLAAFAARHARVSEARIREILEQAQEENEDPEQALLAELETWPEGRAAGDAWWESVRYGNALALTVYALAGRRRKLWVSFGDTCPYCRDLNGQTIGIMEWFIPAGAEFQPEGAERPLVTNWNTGHPPAHRGCDCMVASA